MVSLDQLRHLQSPEGERLLADIAGLAPTASTTITVSTRLRKAYPADLVSTAMALYDLRARARTKFRLADEMWFTRDGLEQATSESIATWRARRFAALPSVVDLCCGIGGDLIGLGTTLPDIAHAAVDLDPLHLVMAQSNARVAGFAERVTFVESDVRDVVLAPNAGIFIDPARRSERGRMALGESEPSLAWSVDLARGGRAVGIKCAPGLEHERIPDGWEFEAIALGSDLKEGVLWSPAIARHSRSATVIDTVVHHFIPVAGDPVEVRTPEAGETLLDPNPAITRAGLVEDLARTVGADKIDERIGFMVANDPVATPFARSLRIVASLPWNERKVKAALRELGAGPVDVRRRGLAGDVDAIAKRLRGKGSRPFTVAMTRVADAPWAIICEVPRRSWARGDWTGDAEREVRCGRRWRDTGRHKIGPYQVRGSAG